MKIGIKYVLNKINVFFVLYLLVLCICIVIKAIFTREEIYFAVNSHYSIGADVFFSWFTNIGNGLTTVGVILLLLMFYSYRKAFLLATSYAITSLFAQVLKHIFDAPRPKAYFGMQLDHIHFAEGVKIYTLHSFPSGHSVTVFSTALVLAYFSRNKMLSVLLLLTAVLTGFSRMYLSEHFFEDVIAGSAVGVMVTLLWLSFMDNYKFLHSEKWSKALLKR